MTSRSIPSGSGIIAVWLVIYIRVLSGLSHASSSSCRARRLVVVLYGYSILHLTAVLTSGWVEGTRKGIPSIALAILCPRERAVEFPGMLTFSFISQYRCQMRVSHCRAIAGNCIRVTCKCNADSILCREIKKGTAVFLEYSMSLLLALTNFGNLLNSCALILYTNKVFKRGSTPYSNGENLANLKMPGYYVIDFLISCHVMLLIKGKRTVSEWEEKLFVSIAGVTSHPIPLCAAATSMWEANKRPLRPHGSLLIRTRHNMHSSIKDGRPSELLLTSRDCAKRES